eukprot:6093979-Pleurochrysis_carterae.AAC.2
MCGALLRLSTAKQNQGQGWSWWGQATGIVPKLFAEIQSIKPTLSCDYELRWNHKYYRCGQPLRSPSGNT